ncbi:MAG: bifunctional phosphopantothenoylcysteine decarboxylase/phosphopantothenate--cysteine ligase CoaBC [Lishizhenia sp.]
MLQGKKILLGITGGIAAYKIAFLIRLLKKSGADVKCIMTSASADFITPLTAATLSKNPVHLNFWNKENGEWTNHVDLGMWGDVFLIAPLTANTLFKLTNGCCDNLLTATYLSAKCPVIVAPAMDLDMYAHAATERNLSQLEKDGVQLIPAQSGELASGLVGKGRMTEPEDILHFLENHFKKQTSLSGKKYLITAGPTYEQIDPVRFIGNHSTGKMGLALAKSLLERGANVTVVLGPTKEYLEHPNLTLIPIKSAQEMLETVQLHWSNMDGGIFSAAVADYRPKQASEQKIKKKSEELTLTLVKNPDILFWAGSVKTSNQTLIGFALETNDAVEHATKKLEKKNLDAIVINTLEDNGAGFGYPTNKISILDKHNNFHKFELKSKTEVAEDIVHFMMKQL